MVRMGTQEPPVQICYVKALSWCEIESPLQLTVPSAASEIMEGRVPRENHQ